MFRIGVVTDYLIIDNEVPEILFVNSPDPDSLLGLYFPADV
jgi:hypothetical protein